MNNQAIVSLVSHPPIDWVILLVVLVVLLIDSFRSGTGRAAAITLAAPLSYFLYEALTHAAILVSILAGLKSTTLQAVVFAAIFVVVTILIHRIMYAYGGKSSAPLQSIIASLSATIVLVAVWVHVPLLDSVWHFAPMFQTAFGAAYTFWWIIGAYLALAFVRS